MAGFALNLDLTLYFEDLRKYASIYVDSTKCKEVGDVEDHIKTVFKLEDNICLTNKRFLVPRCETIQILQQYETLKVQKCDFFDYQIHKNKRSNPSCDQPALNLIQSDRTIDLSCRPKQRLKINICQNRCVLEPPLTPFENGKIRNLPQPSVASSDNVLDGISEIQTKYKAKNKKKKYDNQKGEETNNDECTTSILDMSVKKLKKKNKNDCNLASEMPQINMQTPFNCVTKLELNQESSSEYKRKSKKRKKLVHVEEVDLANSCWDNLVADEESGGGKKRKTKSNNSNKECNDGVATDLSLTLNNNLENVNKESQPNLAVYDASSVRKKHKSERKSAELKNHNVTDEDDLSNKTISQLNNSQITVNTPEADINSNIKCHTIGGAISKKNFDDYKRGLEEKVDILLHQIDLETPSSDFVDVDRSNLLNTFKITDTAGFNREYIQINGKQSCSEDKSLESFQDSSETKSKRKRVRKHNKKKKRETREYLSAVGPVLSRIVALPEDRPSPTTSELAKHIFFTDDDFIEEMKIPATPPNASQSILQGDPENENQGLSQDNTSLDTSRASDKNSTWHQELLKLTTCTSKPVVFQRNSQPPFSNKNDSPSKTSKNSSTPSTQCIENPVKNMNKSEGNIVVQIAEELNCKSKHSTICNGESTLNSMEVDLKAHIKTRSVSSDSRDVKPDLKNVILTDYPVIDKVIAEDLILFKILKLSENYQPQCSNTILAKVNNATHFPEKISLQVLEGFEECDPLTRTVESGECFIVELQWSDIVEPRLFYP